MSTTTSQRDNEYMFVVYKRIQQVKHLEGSLCELNFLYSLPVIRAVLLSTLLLRSSIGRHARTFQLPSDLGKSLNKLTESNSLNLLLLMVEYNPYHNQISNE